MMMGWWGDTTMTRCSFFFLETKTLKYLIVFTFALEKEQELTSFIWLASQNILAHKQEVICSLLQFPCVFIYLYKMIKSFIKLTGFASCADSLIIIIPQFYAQVGAFLPTLNTRWIIAA